MLFNEHTKIFIAGHNGMVGSAVWRNLASKGFKNLIGRDSASLDLRNQAAVNTFFETEGPEVVIDAAAKVGGILANNTYPYAFLMDNLQIQNNLIDAAHRHGVQKFIFLGSSCIYPRMAPQPLKEEYLLTSSLESTNEWYALAKITGVKACEAIRKEFNKDFVALMPTNLYGPNDNFDLLSSHVLPAMIRKFHEAKIKPQVNGKHEAVELWGSGSPLREFLHVDDLAEAVYFTMVNILPESLYNVGSGIELQINELARLIQKIVGHQGEVQWDKTKPDGTPRKLMDSSRITSLGWHPSIELKEGIERVYQHFLRTVE
jgi:GDP-L-fucose synthase